MLLGGLCFYTHNLMLGCELYRYKIEHGAGIIPYRSQGCVTSPWIQVKLVPQQCKLLGRGQKSRKQNALHHSVHNHIPHNPF